MKINQQGLHESQLDGAARARRTDLAGVEIERSGPSRGRQVGLDRVDVSEVAEMAADVMAAAGEQRAARIGHLKALYESHQYTVDPGRLADSIIDADSEIVP
jgi:anti-sigma28 factor (negative regulator of flagellin synthesis)